MTNKGGYGFDQVSPVRLDPAKLVEQAAAAGNLRTMLGKIVGDDRRYLRLVAKMVEYGRLDRPGIWPEKASATDFMAIRKMLALTGELPFELMNSKAPMDEALFKALGHYQGRQGLKVSGEIDTATLEQLNLPLTERVRRIKANLERRRWQNRSSETKELYLNLVDGQLKLLENDKTRSLIAVGADEGHAKLPSFYGKVTGLSKTGVGSKSKIGLHYSGLTEAGKTGQSGVFLIGNTDGKANEFLAMAIGSVDQAGLSTLDDSGEVMELSEPLELFVTYLTVWATRNGKIQFRPDIYNRDAALIEALGL